MFRTSHKAYYINLDIDILNEYRTVANSGVLSQMPKKPMVEIDVGKAYTSALMKITRIPIFNEFDNFKPYNNEVIKELNLHIVKNKSLSPFLITSLTISTPLISPKADRVSPKCAAIFCDVVLERRSLL